MLSQWTGSNLPVLTLPGTAYTVQVAYDIPPHVGPDFWSRPRPHAAGAHDRVPSPSASLALGPLCANSCPVCLMRSLSGLIKKTYMESALETVKWHFTRQENRCSPGPSPFTGFQTGPHRLALCDCFPALKIHLSRIRSMCNLVTASSPITHACGGDVPRLPIL